jgi:hypothetical protein
MCCAALPRYGTLNHLPLSATYDNVPARGSYPRGGEKHRTHLHQKSLIYHQMASGVLFPP